jgi:hypothetical protein
MRIAPGLIQVFMKSFKFKPKPFAGSAGLRSASIDCRVDFFPRLRFFTAPESAATLAAVGTVGAAGSGSEVDFIGAVSFLG